MAKRKQRKRKSIKPRPFPPRKRADEKLPFYHEGILHDITERTHMEKMLQESEEKYRALVENSPNMIGIFQDGALKYVNSAGILKLGWTYEELVSPSFDPIENAVSQKSRNLLKENVGKRLRGEDVAPYEISLTKKDGSEVPVLVRAAKIIYKQKPAIEFVFDDITERKQMHDELERYSKHLQDSEGKLRALHQHALQLGSASNIEEIVKSTLDAIEFALGFDVADVYLAAGDSLRVRGTRGAPLGLSEEHLNGRGLVAKAARNQATVRVSDTTKEPDYADRKGWDWTGPHTMLSELAVPVVVDAETVAVLNAESIRLDAFSVEDRNLLEILASHGGSAYKRLNYEGKLIALHKHAQQLASATSLDEIVKYTLDAIESPLGAELADFYVVDTEKECLRLVGLRGWSPSFSELSLRGPGFTVMAANSQQTVRISDISKEEGYVDSAGLSGKAVSTTRFSELAVPVIVEGQTVAVLNVESSQLNAFNDEDQRLLETLAVHVGSALGRLRQVEELEIMARFPSENPNPILRLDRHGTVLSANEASKALLQDWGSGIGQAAPKSWRDLVTDVRSCGEGKNIDIEFGGRSYTFLVKPIVEGDYVNLYGRDITERKRAEEKLRQSEERYHSLFDQMLDGAYFSTHEGRFVDVNPAFVKMFGYSSKQEMSDITDIKKELYFSPEERGSHLLDTGQEEVEVYRMRRKDGSEIWVEDHGGYVHDEQGNIIFHEGLLRDVTERVRAERALSESEERYRLLFEKSPVGIGLADANGTAISENEMMQGTTGYSLEDFKKINLADTYENPDERRKLLEIVDRDGSVTNFPMRLKRKDGTPYHALLSVSRIHVGDKDVLQTVLLDITKQKQMEEALRQHAKELEALQATVLDITRRQDLPTMLRAIVERAAILLRARSGGLYTCDPERQMVQCIVSYNTLKDYTGTVLKFGEGAAGTVASTGQPLIIADYRSWLARAGVFEQDQPFGALLSVPMIWEGQVTGVIHVLDKESRHFTEGDLALLTLFANHAAIALENARYSENLEELVGERTRKLRESEEKYRELFEACPVSLWEEDFSAVKQFLCELRQKGVSDLGAYFANHPKDVAKCAALVKVLNMNKATLNLYDAKSVDEIIGGLSGVLTEESNRAFVGEVVALVQGKKYYEAEFENRTLRGETKHCDVICAVVPGYEQSLAKVLISIVDLTPQKQLEAELVKSQRLAAIGETAAMVGHDLRNPLQGIAGAVHLLKKESLTAKERDEMLEIIQDNVEYGDTIVRDLLDYSATEIQLNLAEATPKSITRDAIGAAKAPQNVTVQDLSEDQPTLRVDPDRMKRIFINLIENAIDAMPQGGTITISSKVNDGSVEIALTDTGPGIPAKVMEHLWKPLQTTKAKGLGLGLAICKRIMDAHGGSMSVKSEVGSGTTFTIQLPIRPVEVKQK